MTEVADGEVEEVEAVVPNRVSCATMVRVLMVVAEVVEVAEAPVERADMVAGHHCASFSRPMVRMALCRTALSIPELAVQEAWVEQEAQVAPVALAAREVGTIVMWDREVTEAMVGAEAMVAKEAQVRPELLAAFWKHRANR
jgi:hypothetical protein